MRFCMAALSLLAPACALVNTPFPASRLRTMEGQVDTLNATAAILASELFKVRERLANLQISSPPPQPPPPPPPPDWQILVVGAQGTTMRRYDIGTDTWSTKMKDGTTDLAVLPHNLWSYGSGAVELNGFMYVMAGEWPSGTYNTRCDRYDPVANTWTRVADMVAARGRHVYANCNTRSWPEAPLA